MAAKETDEYTSYPETFIEIAGTSLKAALEISRKYGAVTDDMLKFDPTDLYQGKTETFYTQAAKWRIASFHNLGKNIGTWRAWLAEHGPILTRLNVDKTWDKVSSGYYELDSYDAVGTRGGHAVALVGYDEKGFIVRNSWGVKWGDKGFAHASDNYAAAAFTEAYGVVV